jgi:tRNA U34 2-thiouridine synthase MnmA/TrmU
VKLRYRSAPIPATVDRQLSTVNLTAPFEAATPGQTAVLLKEDAVIGWGTIGDPSRTVRTLLPLAAPAHV